MKPPPPRRRRPWLRAAWVAWGVLTAGWIAAVEGLRWTPADWPAQPVAWWTGDRVEHRPLLPMEARLVEHAEVVRSGGPAWFRVRPPGAVELGRLAERCEAVTWAFWLRVPAPHPRAAGRELEVAALDGPRRKVTLALQDGVLVVLPVFPFDPRHPQEAWGYLRERYTLRQALVPGRWQHVAVVTTGLGCELLVDGRLAGTTTLPAVAPPEFMQLAFSVGGRPRVWRSGDWPLASDEELLAAMRADDPGWAVEFADATLYDRALPAAAVRALAAAGRGRLARHFDGPEQGAHLLRRGWPASVAWLALLALVSLAPGRTVDLGRTLRAPAFRPVWAVLLCGGAATVVLTVWLQRSARAMEARRFAELSGFLQEGADTFFEKAAAAVGRVQDWVAVREDFTEAEWLRWCRQTHLVHELGPGLVGLGYAQQVLPEDVPAYEARRTAELGFPFRIWPATNVPPRPARLAGEPRLPVALYRPRTVPDGLWRTNGTVLGRDMLSPGPGVQVWNEPRRIEEAVVQGEFQSSGVERVAPAAWFGRPVEGLRLYAPVLTQVTGADPDRQIPPAAWRGVAFADLDVRAQLESLRAGRPLPLGFRIHVGTEERHECLLNTAELDPQSAWRPQARHQQRMTISLYHYRLLLDVWSTPAFEAESPRRWAWLATAGGAGFTLLAAGLLGVQVRARRREQAANSRLRAALARLRRAHLDRNRLSRDLHDGTLQSLYAVGLQMEHARSRLPAMADRAKESLGQGRRLVQEAIGELRGFLGALPEENLRRRTLRSVLEELAGRLRAATEAEISMELAPVADALPARAVVQVVNVVREAVSNAVRHGRPGRIGITLAPAGEGWLRLTVQDDGAGFTPGAANGLGLGLQTMRGRAAELGGRLEVHSAPGLGTEVTLTFPAEQAMPG